MSKIFLQIRAVAYVALFLFSFLSGANAAQSGDADSATGMQVFNKIAEYDLLGYPLWRLGGALLLIIAALILNTIFRFLLKKRQQHEDALEKGDEKSLLGMIIDSAQIPVRILVWGSAIRLIGPTLMVQTSHTAWLTKLVFSVSAAVFSYKLVEVASYYMSRFAEKTDTKLDDMLVPVIRKSLRILVVIIAGLHIYNSATGQPITTLLAGLGLGGLAFALAAQDTLKNIFGFIMILTDRPFVIGERIKFSGHDGIVESVGFRSVRVRRLDGHLVSIPNAKAADEIIHNIGKRPYIRRLMDITITYDTPVEKIEKAVEMLRELLKDHEGLNPEYPPRVYFNDFNAESLNIKVIYWYHPPEYWKYLEHAQRLNLAIMKCFEAEGIEFAFPTQTIYLAGDPKRNLVLQNFNKQI